MPNDSVVSNVRRREKKKLRDDQKADHPPLFLLADMQVRGIHVDTTTRLD